jgi:DNA mismatch repair protein MSH4
MTFIQDDLRKSFPKNSLRINYIEPAGVMGLDRTTVESLELLQNMRKTNSKTLFSLLDSTLTPQGKRLLRSTLLQPSTDANVIKDRHDAIDELIGNEGLFVELVKRLKALQRVDAEKLGVWVGSFKHLRVIGVH